MSNGQKEFENGRYEQRFYMDDEDTTVEKELSIEEYLQKLILNPRTPNNVSEYLVKVREQLIKSK